MFGVCEICYSTTASLLPPTRHKLGLNELGTFLRFRGVLQEHFAVFPRVWGVGGVYASNPGPSQSLGFSIEIIFFMHVKKKYEILQLCPAALHRMY